MAALAKHYKILSAAERFTLTLQAMARGDESDADRLGDSCPQRDYRCDDVRFRGRMRLAHVIVLKACLNMRTGLAQLQLAVSFFQECRDFAAGAVASAQATYLCGREFGRQEAGVPIPDELPSRAALDRELASNAPLRAELEGVQNIAEETFVDAAGQLLRATARRHADSLLAQWRGLDRFASSRLGVDGPTLLAAFGLQDADPTAEVAACDPAVAADEKAVQQWSEFWIKRWDRLFAQDGAGGGLS